MPKYRDWHASWAEQVRDVEKMYSCPTCGAAIGEKCVSNTGKLVSATFGYHAARTGNKGREANQTWSRMQPITRDQIDEAFCRMDEGFQPPLHEQAQHWSWFVKDVEQDEDAQIAHCAVVLVFEDVEVPL